MVPGRSTAAEQAARFQFVPEGRGRAGVRIHGGATSGIRIGVVHATHREFTDQATGIVMKRTGYSAVADAVVANGIVSTVGPSLPGWTRVLPRQRCCTALDRAQGPTHLAA